MEEHARKFTHSERHYTGAAFLGWFSWFGTNATFPFGQLQVSPRELTIRIGMGKWTWESATLLREEVRQVVVKRRLWVKFVRFVHGKRGCPEYVMFWCSSLEPLLLELRAMGYPMAPD